MVDQVGKDRVQFVLRGSGTKLQSLRKQAGDLANIVFPGWISAPSIQDLMQRLKIDLAAYAASAPQSLPNKPVEYMAGGLPVRTPDVPVIKEVLGRIEDVVNGPDSRQMVRFHGVFVNQPHVREGQIIQESLDCIRVKVVPAGGFGAQDIQDIVHRVQQRLGEKVKVIDEPVAEIPRTKTGKYQAVVSNLKKKVE